MTVVATIRFASMLGLALLVAPMGAAAQTAAPASPPPAAWHKQQGPGGVFTVEMPAKPGYKLEQAKSGRWHRVRLPLLLTRP